jgi:choline kinase
VVDFEYASLNPAAFDIANHFHEWTTNYTSSTPHILVPTLYPSSKQRRNFYLAYLHHTSLLSPPPSDLPNFLTEGAREFEVQRLEHQVRAWSPASHGMWAVWAIVQAREDVEGVGEREFDYVGYALCRMQGFRKELRQLGI